MSGSDIKEWIICLVIGGVLYYAMEACEKRQREEPETEQKSDTSWNFNSNSSTSSTAATPSASNEVLEWEPVVEEPAAEEPEYTYSYSYSSSIGGGGESSSYEESNRYDNYEETNSCVDGEVVYEGTGDYYIVETMSGYTIVERRLGGFLYEGDRVRGKLNSYSYTYIINKRNDTEVSIYIEDYMLSKDRAIEWMGSHNRLKSRDQDAYDMEND